MTAPAINYPLIGPPCPTCGKPSYTVTGPDGGGGHQCAMCWRCGGNHPHDTPCVQVPKEVSQCANAPG